jgi:hypothetical protein
VIEFKHNGRIWKTDTVDEAITLRRKLENDDRALWEAGEEIPTWEEERKQAWSPDIVTDLLKHVGLQQRKFLRVLAEGNHKRSEEILEALGLKSEESLAGVLSGLSKQLKKLGIPVSELYAVQVEWTGKAKKRFFWLTREFRSAAEELGWPDQWEQ